MIWYVLRRLSAILPILFGVSVVCFSFVHLAPGDAISAVTPDNATPELRAQIREMYGYDQPLRVQYFRWLGQVASGNLGTSILTGRAVAGEVIRAVQNTAVLAVAAIALSLSAGLLMGLGAAYARSIWADRLLTAFGILGVSVPHYWTGMVLVAIFSVHLGLLPAMGMGSGGVDGRLTWDDLRFVILPAVTLSLIPTAIISRSVRATVIEVRKQDFVQTLEGLGLSGRRISAHVAKNAAPTIIAVIGLQIAQLLGGSILVETVFAWPGTGFLLNSAIASRDLPLLQGTVLVLATFFVLMNFLVDLVQPLLDPRITRE